MAAGVNPKTLPPPPPAWAPPADSWAERYIFPSDGKGSAGETSKCVTAMRRCVASRCGRTAPAAKFIINADVRRCFDRLLARFGSDGLMDAWRCECDASVRDGDDFENAFCRLLGGKWAL